MIQSTGLLNQSNLHDQIDWATQSNKFTWSNLLDHSIKQVYMIQSTGLLNQSNLHDPIYWTTQMNGIIWPGNNNYNSILNSSGLSIYDNYKMIGIWNIIISTGLLNQSSLHDPIDWTAQSIKFTWSNRLDCSNNQVYMIQSTGLLNQTSLHDPIDWAIQSNKFTWSNRLGYSIKQVYMIQSTGLLNQTSLYDPIYWTT